MAFQTDKIQLIVGVDTKEGIRQLGYLQAEYARLADAQKKTLSYTDSQNLNNAMGVLKDKIADARKEYGLTGQTTKELRQYMRELVADQSRYTSGTDQYKELQFEIEKVSQRLKDVVKNTEAVEQEQQNLRAELQRTIELHGTEALSLEQLKKLQGILYADMIRGAKSGNLANGEQVKSYQQVAVAVAKAEAATSKSTLVERANIQAVLAGVKANGLMSLSLNEMRDYHKHLTDEIENSAEHESELNKQRIKEAQEVAATIDKRESNIKGTSGILDTIKTQLPAALVGGLAGGIAAFALSKVDDVIAGIKQKFEEGIKYIKQRSRDITEIETTLNISLFDATKLNSQLSSVDTERPREQLKQLVLVAGDLNTAQKDVIDFVKQADKVERVFSRDFGDNIGEASTKIAKLKDTFAETRSLNINESFDKIGSSIRVLNEEGPATTKGIVDFIARIGQLPDAFKPSITAASALGAVFEEANLTAEISSGGINNILLTASKNGEVFGKAFGMAKSEFLSFLTTDPAGFLTKFAEKVKGLNEAQVGEFLKTLSINSDEATKTIGVLSDNLDKFRKKEVQAIEAFNSGTRLDEIFKTFNNDGAAEITKAEKKFEIFFNKISGVFGAIGKSFLVSIAQVFPDFESALEKTNRKMDEQRKLVNALDGDVQKHINTIDEYKRSGDKSGISQAQLKVAIDAVARAIPSAITQFNSLGEAMDINTAAAERNIKKQRDLMRELRQNAIESNKESLTDLQKKADQIQYQLNKGTTFENNGDGFVTERRMTDDEIKQKQSELKSLGEDIKATKEGLDEIKYGISGIKSEASLAIKKGVLEILPKEKGKNREFTANQKVLEQNRIEFEKADKVYKDLVERKAGEDEILTAAISRKKIGYMIKFGKEEAERIKNDRPATGTFSTGGDGKGEDKAKKAADQYAKEIDKLAEITFKQDQALATEEDKKVLGAERQSQIQESSINKEILNETRRKQALEANELELVNSVTAIRNEYKEKREKQVAEQATKAVEIAQKRALTEKQLAVATAEASNDEFQIYNAKFDLNEQLKTQDIASLEAKYIKEQDALKGNNEALKLLHQNYKDEVLVIKAKYIAEDDKLLLALLKNTKEKTAKEIEIKKKADLEKSQLDLQEAEQTPGGNVLGAKLSLLNLQMAQELSVANLTEQEKTNITRKYDLQRASLQTQSFQKVAAQAIELFGQAFGAISGLFSDRLKREESEENAKFEHTSEQLEAQKEKGILTNEQYTKQKTASEKVHDKELRKIKYEQAKAEKGSNVVQAVINGIQAVMKGYAETGPLGGTVLAVIMGAISALNIGRIVAQPLPSLYSGGPTPDRIERPIDSLGGFLAINHPGEFMVSAEMRKTPEFVAIEPMLMSIKQRGRSFYGGGPVDDSGAVVRLPNGKEESNAVFEKLAKGIDKNNVAIDKLTSTQEKLNSKLDNLEVRLGGHDYEKLHEGLDDYSSQNRDALIGS